MKNLASKELVLKITGEVQETNLVEFEQAAIAVLNDINLELTTDQDFIEAEANIKDCKLVETRIGQLALDAIHSQEEVSKMMTLVEKLEGKFRGARLTLEKSVKKEKETRKKEIVDAGISNITQQVNESPVSFGFTANIKAIKDAIKGKRSIDKMTEAVEAVVADEVWRLGELEDLYTANMAKVVASEKDYPGLFPDKKNICISPITEVELTISARVEKQKNELREAEERKEALAKACRERDESNRAFVAALSAAEPHVAKGIPKLPPEPALPPLPREPEMLPEHKIEVVIFGEYANVARVIAGIKERHPGATVNYLGAR